MRTNRQARISIELFNKRKQDQEILRQALKGLKIPEIEIDRFYARKLQNIDVREILRGYK